MENNSTNRGQSRIFTGLSGTNIQRRSDLSRTTNKEGQQGTNQKLKLFNIKPSETTEQKAIIEEKEKDNLYRLQFKLTKPEGQMEIKVQGDLPQESETPWKVAVQK